MGATSQEVGGDIVFSEEEEAAAAAAERQNKCLLKEGPLLAASLCLG